MTSSLMHAIGIRKEKRRNNRRTRYSLQQLLRHLSTNPMKELFEEDAQRYSSYDGHEDHGKYGSFRSLFDELQISSSMMG